MDRTRAIHAIRSGGQTGVDRGALDAARAAGVPICGWCPSGGWAEDAPTPPGILAAYPELQETPAPDPVQRTEWNVRDSDATLIVQPQEGARSPGTDATARFAEAYDKPFLVVGGVDVPVVARWLEGLASPIRLNVAGPRESECPGAYRISHELVTALLSR